MFRVVTVAILLLFALTGITYAQHEIYLPAIDSDPIPPTPTATAAPIPDTPPIDGLLPILSSSYHTSTVFALEFVGITQNTTDEQVSFVETKVNLFNGPQLIGANGWFIFEPIPPQAKTCLRMWRFSIPTDPWNYYDIEDITPRSVDFTLGYDLTVIDSGYVVEDGTYRFSGFIENQDSSDVEFTALKLAVYDGEGRIIRCGESHDVNDIVSGQRASFEFEFENLETVGSYEYFLVGYSGGNPTFPMMRQHIRPR